jgi:uncharacterized cupin superfamily protein
VTLCEDQAMDTVNAFTSEYEVDESDPEGYRAGAIRMTRALGASALAVKVFEVPPGQSVCPYHYEYEEEWLVVLEGSIVLRTPGGEQTLQRGEIVAFPTGPAGAHKTTNEGGDTARLMMFSSAREPALAVYPDSDKIGIYAPTEQDSAMLHRADGAVDYYDGEA